MSGRVAVSAICIAWLGACTPAPKSGGAGTGGRGSQGTGGVGNDAGVGAGGSDGAASGGASATGGANGSGSGGASGGPGSGGSSGGNSGASGGATGTGGGPAGGGAAGAGAPTGGAAGGGGMGGAAGSSGGAAGGGGAPGTGGTAGGPGSGGAPVACQAPMAVTGTAVSVAVNLGMTRATVSNDLLGIHSSVYDNHFRDATTPPLLKAAGLRSIRYPGGSYGDLYHWSTHTGTTHAKGTASEGIPYLAPTADFGNFIGLIESAGAAGFITVNYGSNPQGTGPGVPQEAAAWVAYANGSTTNTTAIGI
ncbi:MAG: hypothetical protein ABUS79_11030, partial [Pseudomonadota bacterium]